MVKESVSIMGYLSNGGLSKTVSIIVQGIIILGAGALVGYHYVQTGQLDSGLIALIAYIGGHQTSVYSSAITASQMPTTTTTVATPGTTVTASTDKGSNTHG